MNLTDFYFLCAFAIILPIYYLVPSKYRWGVILVGSIAFYLTSGYAALILYPIVSVVVVYLCAKRLTAAGTAGADPAGEQGDAGGQPHAGDRSRRKVLTAGVVILLAVLIILKYTRFIWVSFSSDPVFVDSVLSALIPLGLSYYTFTLISYLVDVYNGIAVPEKNFFKLLTFGMYAPALVSGPIMQYREVGAGFFADHPFDWTRITRGLQRMLWGFFKKLVIAERLGLFVASVYGIPPLYGGIYVWAAIVGFTIQLYSDFSGLMDIVLGISECLGLTLPENFDPPFFSRTIAELWRRWHITLGTWCREYVFFPLLRTKLHTSINTRLEKRFARKIPEDDPDKRTLTRQAKKKAKRISTFMAMFVLWLTVGFWHGGNLTFVIGSGILQWFYIVMEELLEEPFKKLWNKMGIDPACKALDLLRMVRTFLLFSFGMAFFRSPSVKDAMTLLGFGFKAHNPEVVGLFSGMASALASDGVRGLRELSSFGLSYTDIIVLAFSLILLLAVDIAKTRTDVRTFIAGRPAAVRFIIWFGFLFYVIMLGMYGPGFDASEFIYQGF